MVESFTVSNDPEFTEKVRDVAGIYLNPPEAAIVLCVDEKTQVQALDRTQPIRPMVPGVPLRQTTEYKRNGISNHNVRPQRSLWQGHHQDDQRP